MAKNNVQKLREEMLMSKAELARKAGVSALTIDRIEGGKSCRMDTKRKIILALGFKLSDKEKVFAKEEANRKAENLAKKSEESTSAE
jgi:DNA-binding XRE family transcriptional regulator